MVVLPIVARELRVASRRKGVYHLRLAAGLLTLALGSYFLFLGDNIAATVPAGRILFLILSVLLAIGALAAAHETYDSISAEKREGTIGFLFLTELFPHDIVLGKLCAGALPSFYAMLATFPLLAAAAMMGGVTGGEVWRMCLALLNLFFFAQSAALLASSIFRLRAAAGLAAFLVVAFFTAGLGAWSSVAASSLLRFSNPAYDFLLALGASKPAAARGFWLSFATVNVIAWVFLALASLALPRLWFERPAQEQPFLALTRPTASVGDQRPFTWLAHRTSGNSGRVWPGFTIAASLALLALTAQRHAAPLVLLLAVMAPHAVLKLWIAAASSRATEEHRRNGLFELLIGCTPLTGADVLEGQRSSLLRLFLGPAIALFVLDIILANMAPYQGVAACLVGAALQLPLDLAALAWTSMWFAVSQSKPRRAAATACILVCVIPTVFLSVPLGVALNQGAGAASSALVWVVVGWAVDIALLFLARQKLRIYFRAMGCGAPEEARKLRLFVEPAAVLAG